MGLNWLRVLQLQNGILPLPVNPAIALPDCKVLVDNLNPMQDWYDGLPRELNLPDFSKYEGSIEEQIYQLEFDIGKAFLNFI